MRFYTFYLVATSLLVACNPTFNWRDVRPENTRLGVLMPCKPEKAQKTVVMGGKPVELNLVACDAGGATFAVSVADVGRASDMAATLTRWQSATLANMKATPNTPVTTVKVAGLPGGAALVAANGQRVNGQAVSSQAVYFVQGTQVFQAVMYAAEIKPEVAETFFSSLKFE